MNQCEIIPSNTAHDCEIYTGFINTAFVSSNPFTIKDADAITQTAWITLFHDDIDKRIYPFTKTFKAESKDPTPQEEKGSAGNTLILFFEGAEYSFERVSTLKEHARLITWENQTVYVIFGTNLNYLQGINATINNSDAIKAIKCKITINKIESKDNASRKTKITLKIDSGQQLAFERNGKEIYCDTTLTDAFIMDDVDGLKDVNCIISNITSSSFTATIQHENKSPILHFVESDFFLKDSNNNTVTIAVQNNENGTYTITPSTSLNTGTYTFGLKTPKTMLTKWYEMRKPIEFDI